MTIKKNLLFVALVSVAMGVTAGRRVTFQVNVERPLAATSVSELKVPASLMQSAFGYSSQADVTNAINNKQLQLAATYTTSTGKESFYTTFTSGSGIGHWFNVNGYPTNKERNKIVCVIFNGSSFSVTHDADNATEGTTYTVKESLIAATAADTITYCFTVKVGGSKMSVSSDQKAVVFGRSNYVDSWLVKPIVTDVKAGKTYNQNWLQVDSGADVTLSATLDASIGTAKYAWLDRHGNTIRSFKPSADFTLTGLTKNDAGQYTLKARISKAEGGSVIKEYTYFIDVQDARGEFYDWPANTAKFGYNFRDEYPTLEEPKKVHNIKKHDGTPANCYAGKWWSCFWGDKLNPQVGMDSLAVYDAAKNMVDFFDDEFAYIRDVMGWPPDLNAREGWKSYIYIFGSGLEFDNTDSLTTGGYQGAYYVDGKSYACVTCSYLPFARFRSDADILWTDGAWQRNAMVHEGIHAILANMAGVKGSSWFHEAGNTWLQGRMSTLRSASGGEEADDARAGWLDGGPFIAPFMPVECYSGWLQDGSFGGPGAEGVNRYNKEGQQLCTWRRYLGGTQYGNSFPYILASFCGDGSIPWIWRWCEGRVLEGIGDSIGEDAMRKVVLQYRSRMSIYDFGIGYKSYRNVCSDNFGATIGPEYEPYWIKCADWKMTPYARPALNDDEGWLAPDTLTNPGWSGANFIPIHVAEGKDRVEVEFRPEDTNMMAQLCYRTKKGTAYYSQPVFCGTLSLDISDRPANGVVILVVANTDYIYTGDEQRAHHWDYRIRLGDGAMAVADNYKKWFFFEQDITDEEYEAYITGIEDASASTCASTNISSNAWYDLAGRKVAEPKHGIYIHNGKKVYVK